MKHDASSLFHDNKDKTTTYIWGCCRCSHWAVTLCSNSNGSVVHELGNWLTGHLCPISVYGSPVTLLKFQMAPKLIHLMSSGSKKKEPRYACLNESKASHSQRMWAEVFSCTPQLLHSGMSSSPSRWRCLLWVLCPVRRPVTTLDHKSDTNNLTL